MPRISAVYSPRLAAPTLLLIDTICALPFALRAMPQCNWREVAPVSVAGAAVLPFGALALVLVDPLWLRWFIAGLVPVALVTLAAGALWFHGTSDALYRRAVYLIIALTALVSLPVFDALR